MSFLPKGYEPKAAQDGAYLNKFPKGETRIRILTDAVTGWEYWTTDNKPHRVADAPDLLPEDTQKDDKGNYRPPKQFWAFVVWDYSEEKIKICSVTQATIQKQIISLMADEDWGTPLEYDIKITREGEGLETKYQISPAPKKEITAPIATAFTEQPINLDALLIENGNPFEEVKKNA